MKHTIFIPADVPQKYHQTFVENYTAITGTNGKMLLFAGDQKLEHLNADFYGPKIHNDAAYPDHLFEIASKGRISALATHLGLITRYGLSYPTVNYIVKLNGKTNIIPTKESDPISRQLWSVSQVIALKEQTNLALRGIGYTIYLGSKYENIMLEQAAQAVYEAHQHGLVAILWIYPRGHNVPQERSFHMITGAAGVATTLGADFAKINPPDGITSKEQAFSLSTAAQAAGNTKLICSGGERVGQQEFLAQLYEQVQLADTWGNAIGRNIYQQSLEDAIAFTHAISAIIFDNKTPEEALALSKSLRNNAG